MTVNKGTAVQIGSEVKCVCEGGGRCILITTNNLVACKLRFSISFDF